MFGFGKKKSFAKINIPEEVTGVIINAEQLAHILEPYLGKKISRIGVDVDIKTPDKETYVVHFKEGGHSAFLNEEQLIDHLSDWAGKQVINIGLEARQEYLIRFKI